MKQKYKIALVILFIVITGLVLFYYCVGNSKVYTLKEFSSTGKLLKTHEYIIRYGDTILQGKFINYNEKGIKIADGNL